jgi:hypothetical protein
MDRFGERVLLIRVKLMVHTGYLFEMPFPSSSRIKQFSASSLG